MEPYIKHRYQGHQLLIDRERVDPSFLHIICWGPDNQIAVFKRLESSVYAYAYRFEYRGRHYFYKRFLHRGWKDPLKEFFRGTRAQRSLRGHLQLVRYGFQAPAVVAVGKKPHAAFWLPSIYKVMLGWIAGLKPGAMAAAMMVSEVKNVV